MTEQANYVMNDAILLIIATILCITICCVCFYITVKTSKLKDIIGTLVFLFITIFFIIAVFTDYLIPYNNIKTDLKFQTYLHSTGIIREIQDNAKVPSENWVKINYENYWTTHETLEEMKKNTGNLCEVTYGEKSKFIVDYYIYPEGFIK